MDATSILKSRLNAKQLVMLQSEMESRRKSKFVAYALWIVIGWLFPAQRIYLGQYKRALLMFLTMNGLGVWWVIDGIILSSGVEKVNREIESITIEEILSLNM